MRQMRHGPERSAGTKDGDQANATGVGPISLTDQAVHEPQGQWPFFSCIGNADGERLGVGEDRARPPPHLRHKREAHRDPRARIEGRHDTHRLHSASGYRSPVFVHRVAA
jgi:hypothetical protein